MPFSPILSGQPISYALNSTSFRNAPRETDWRTSPVLFNPSSLPTGQTGYNGPRYKAGYSYYDCPYPENTYNGNCTWWCWGRANDALGVYLPHLGHAKNWYDNYSGSKDTDATNIQPGDIIVLTDSDKGHVMFVEQVSGNTVYISQSAYSQRSVWIGMACLTTSYSKSSIYQGSSIDIYKDIDSPYYCEVVGVIHTGGPGPGPQPGTETPTVTITPSSVNMHLSSSDDYGDITFNLDVSGIPVGETVSGGTSYPGLTRISNGSGWIYSTYTVDGVTYQRATKTGMVLRYDREFSTAYTALRNLTFSKTYVNGTAFQNVPINISADMKSNIRAILAAFVRNRRKRGTINVGKI